MMQAIYRAGKNLMQQSARFLYAMRLGWKIAHEPSLPMPPRRQRPAKFVVPHAPGVFYVQGNPHDRYQITARISRKILPGLYADLMYALGEHVLLVMGEALEGRPAQHVFSFSAPLESEQLRRMLFDYGDIIAHHDAVALTAQNTEKSGSLVLTSEKLLFMEASCPHRFIHTLVAHGLRRVRRMEQTAKPPACSTLLAVDEWRLVEFKQHLGLAATAFRPRVDLIH